MKKVYLVLFILLSFLFIAKVKAYTKEEVGEVIASYAKWVYDNKRSDFNYLLPGEYYHINQTYAGKKSYNGKYGADCNAFVGFIVCNSTNTPCKQVALPNVFQYDGNWIINSSNGWDSYFYRPYTNLSYDNIVSKINNKELKAGDLITRCKDGCKKNTHIQIYVGNGMFVENNTGNPSLRYFHISEMYNKDSSYTVIRISDNGASKITLDNIYYPNGDGNKTNIKDKLNLSFIKKEVESYDTIYIGDSRTHGMLLNGITSESNTVYGSGYGYNWFIGNGSFSSSNTNSVSGGISGANSKMQSGKKYNIVIWLGVNDYSYVSADMYYTKYVSLANNEWKNHNIHIVSVGPVDDSKATYVTNIGINNFNKNMKKLIQEGNVKNINYIDLGYTESSINNYDSEGLHYGKNDYQNIINIINNKVENYSNSESGEVGGKPGGDSGPVHIEIDKDPLTCDEFFSQEMKDIIKTSYTALKIIAIVLVMIYGMLDFGKSITTNDKDMLKKSTIKFVKRLVALVVILILPYIINPLIEMILEVDSGTCNIL